MSELSELVSQALDEPTKRALKVVEKAEELGWTVGKVSLCVRLSKPGDTPDRVGAVALPMYATWTCDGRTKTGRLSWHFDGAAARNLQQLSEDDIPIYLEHPEVIYPEAPEEREGEE